MSSLSSVGGSNTLSVSGLITGLDSDKIIEGLLAVQQGKVDRLTARQGAAATEQRAFKSLEARLLTFQSSVSQLSRSVNGVFDARTTTSSDETLVKAAASSSATAGVYTLRVNSLARAHQVASQGFDSLTSQVTQGTFQITVGGTTKSITVDATNNTLTGLANAINASGAGVSATIVNDGRAQPYRLILTAKATGTANAISVTNGLASDTGAARKPDFASAYVGSAVKSTNYTGTATPTSGGTYTGSANTTYTFTVTGAGTVGTDTVSLSYSDSSGSNTGTITVNAGDVDTFLTAAQGIQVKFAAGTVVAGQTFTVDASVPTVQSAADASVSLGSGPGALTVTNSSNTIDGLIAGVAVNLQGASATKDVTLTVGNDTAKAKKAVQDFVDSYNAVIKFIDDTVRFDPETNAAGVLLGNRTVVGIQDQIRTVATAAVAGLGGSNNRLSVLGVTTNLQGKLELDTAKLDQALAGSVSGLSLEGIGRLFSLGATTTNAAIRFVGGSSRTNATGTAVQVDVTQAATQATVTAANDLAAATVIDNTNNTFRVTVDGQLSGTVTLAAGTYSRSALAQAVQGQINADSALVGRKVTAGLSGNKLTITSASYGSSSQIAISSGGSALAALGLAGTESGTGQNVAGTFTVNGRTETATGRGQVLAGDDGNATTDGLQLLVSLTPGQVQVGTDATLTLTRGVASQLDSTIANLVDPVSGRLKSVYKSYQDRIDAFQATIDRAALRAEAQRQALLKQFVALERSVSELKSNGDFLTAQINALRNLRVN